jgi:hypothetical protein
MEICVNIMPPEIINNIFCYKNNSFYVHKLLTCLLVHYCERRLIVLQILFTGC